ncbi:hypothetical protein PC123_g19966 [Phytophthora cactorum]|nr:hypothetical protein PC123_g19966 [Phytophthora cactorum]
MLVISALALDILFWKVQGDISANGTLDIFNDNTITTTYDQCSVSTGNTSSFTNYVLSASSYHTTNGNVKLGFFATNSNSSAAGKMWIQSNSSFGLSARSSFTGSSAQSDIFIHANPGVVSFGKSGTPISTTHRLEINDSVMVSNTASATSLSNLPIIGVFDSTQATLTSQRWLYWGRDITNNSCWNITSYYTSNFSSTNCMKLAATQYASSSGIIMTAQNNVAINGTNSGGTVITPICPLAVTGYIAVTVPSG